MAEVRWRVAITQPYIPDYRVPLFEGLVALLEPESIGVRFFCGGDKNQLTLRAARKDATTSPRWSEHVHTSTFRLPTTSMKVQYRALPRDWKHADVLVTELQAGNANAWERWASRMPYILLGHGAPYTSQASRLSQALETRLNRRAAHVLTYVPSGRDNVLADGQIQPAKVTAFMNTTDTDLLADLVASFRPADISAFTTGLGIPPSGAIALYAGSLTSAKRIDFLCAAAEDVLSRDQNAYLLIAGDGPERPLIEELGAKYHRVSLLGQADARCLALAGAAAKALLNPGRIGLVAVDALAIGRPVLSTRYAYHAPEAEYLREGKTVFYAEDTPADFAQLWRRALAGELPAARADWLPSIDHSVNTIGRVIVDALGERAKAR